MTAWWCKWRWITMERLAFGNGRWHMRVCPFCAGMNRYLDEQAEARASARLEGSCE